MLRDDDDRVTGDGLPPVGRELTELVGETLHLDELGLRAALRVGQPEMELEDVVTIGILVAQRVVVAVVPGDPAAAPGKQRRVEDLTVVAGRVLSRGEIGADAELFEDDGLVEGSRKLADERRRQDLADLVIQHRVDVRADEVDDRCKRAQRVAVVAPGHLDAPHAVSERHRLGRA